MVDALSRLIAEYGYIAVTLGCLIEGETAILLGVFAANNGILQVQGIFIAAVIGTVFADNVCFHVGRYMGRPALVRRPHWQARVARVETLLARYGAPLMVGFRFLYGLRYVTPFVFGSLGISPLRFFLFDLIGTLLWACVVTVIGVYLASAVQLALAHIHSFEQALLAIVLLGLLVGGVWFWRRRKTASDRSNR